jgi:cysteine-rich repeat protein
LLVAKFDFNYDAQGNDAVRVWVDPADLVDGEAGLGVPDVMRDGFDVWSSLDQIAVFLGPGQSLDALRISDAGVTSARLEEVLVPGCGNGTVDEGEECDDGNGANGDCCTPACRFAAAGTVCRPIAHGCDVAEICTGSTALCPVDLQLPDVDGDGICDCAIDLDVATHDADGDGIRDLDDDCGATPSGEVVDRAGCSQAQFCLGIDVSTTAGRSICKRIDWRGDEVGKLSRDCTVARGATGPADDRCAVRDAE